MDTNRIQFLLSKVHELLHNKNAQTAIEADLILDYLRVVYADMLEVKKEWSANSPTSHPSPKEIEKYSDAIAENKSNSHLKEEEKIGINFEQPKTPELKVIVDDEVLEEEIVAQPNPEKVPPAIEEKVAMPESIAKKDIRKLMGLNDRYLFMNELFNNDKFDYEAVLDYINGIENYSNAEEWLNENYIATKKWDKDDATVESFFAMVNKYFSNLN